MTRRQGAIDKICHYCQKKIVGDGIKASAQIFCSELCHVAQVKKMPKAVPKKGPKTACRFC